MLTKFDLWHLVVLDDGTQFKGDFVAVCNTIYLNYDILARNNHKVLLIEHFHHFLNKATKIVMAYRQSNGVIIPDRIAAEYVQNSAPIDETDILRSTVAIGREFQSLTDNLSALSQLTQNNKHYAVDCLRLTDSNHRFSSSILKILIENRREAYAERVNNDKTIVELVIGDIVMTRTDIQSDTFSNKVAK